MFHKLGPPIVALCVLLACSPAATEPMRVDPVFGLRYDPDKVRFEPAPADITQHCPDLVNPKWNRQLFIYGRAGNPNDVLLALGGYFVDRTNPAVTESDPKGVIAHLIGQQCELIGPAYEVLLFSQDELGAPAVRALANDAVRRYATAFGSPNAFRAALRQQGVKLDHPKAGVLRDAIKPSR
jgi:hypothetical protein